MRRLAAAFIVVCGVVVLASPWLAGPVASYRTGQAQSTLSEQVPAAEHARGGRLVMRRVPHGRALAVMRIPRFGRDWRWVALEGTAEAVIANGPGHYPWTPMPGEPGNVGFAAHRAGHGDPFIDFDRLRPGDRVILSQRAARWTYRLDTWPKVVPNTASWVLDPLPGHRLTLTTCWPKYGSAKRMYVRAHLVQSPSSGTRSPESESEAVTARGASAG